MDGDVRSDVCNSVRRGAFRREEFAVGECRLQSALGDRPPRTIRVIMELSGNPADYMASMVDFLDAEWGDYVRIYNEDQLGELLKEHQGPLDSPAGFTEPSAESGESPYDLNTYDLSRLLARGARLYQWTFFGCLYEDEDVDEVEPEEQIVDEQPEGWLSVREACRIKDTEPSAVNRAVDEDELTTAVQLAPRRRFIKPDAKFDAWNPVRRVGSLMRRRLGLVQTMMERHPHFGLTEVMAMARGEERRLYGSINQHPKPLQHFFEEALGERCPRSIKEWRERIGTIIEAEGVRHTSEQTLEAAPPARALSAPLRPVRRLTLITKPSLSDRFMEAMSAEMKAMRRAA